METKNGKNTKKRNVQMCPYAKKCGGCDYQGIEYKRQLKMKQENVEKLLKPFVKVSPIVGMDNPYHYRHKVHAVFDCIGRGEVVAGVYKKNSHDVVDIESCQIEDEEADGIPIFAHVGRAFQRGVAECGLDACLAGSKLGIVAEDIGPFARLRCF